MDAGQKNWRAAMRSEQMEKELKADLELGLKRATVELHAIGKERGRQPNQAGAERLNEDTSPIEIPPDFQLVAQLIQNAVDEFACHRNSLLKSSGQRLMDNLLPHIREPDGYTEWLEKQIGQIQTTQPMSVISAGLLYAISILRQLEFERGFLGAVERYEDDLVHSAKYRKDMEEREKGKERTAKGRTEQANEDTKQRNEVVYNAIRELFKEGEEVLYKNYHSRLLSKTKLRGTKAQVSSSTFRRAVKDLVAQGLLDKDKKLVGPSQK